MQLNRIGPGSLTRLWRGWLHCLLVGLVLGAGGLCLAPRPVLAQSALTCVNKTTANGLGSNIVHYAYVNGSNVYAATTHGGLAISTNGGNSFTNKTTAHGLGNNDVRGVYASGSTVYAATWGGLSISTNGGNSFSTAGPTNALGYKTVIDVYASDSTLFVGAAGVLGISTNGGGSFTKRTTANGLGSNTVRGLYADGSNVYAGTTGGLAISTDGGNSFTNRTTAHGLGSNDVRGVHADGSNVYAATLGGLSISTNGGNSFTNRTTANGLGNNNMRSVYASGSNVYAATFGGLSISTNGGNSFTNFTMANGLGSHLVYGVYVSGSKVYAATTGGLSICTLMSAVPVIDVSGNNVTIGNGDTSPTTADGSAFGNATVRSGLGVRTFTVRNTGAGDLTGLAVTLTGTAAGDYAVTLPPATTVAPGSSTTFQLRFAPSALGARTATVNIASNDSTQNPYTFDITGNGVAASPGPVEAWGSNGSGESTVPTGLGNVVALEAGETHSIALKDDGTVVTWGSNTYGQQNIPAGLNNVVAIASRHNHTLALKSDGTVVAWGYNWAKQIDVPANLTNVKAIAAGISHSLALKNDGTVVAWGYNTFGTSTVPAGLNNVIAIAAGAEHSLALKGDGTVVAWGNSAYTSVPAGLSGVVAIAANRLHSLALKGDGTVVAWGLNDFGQTAVPSGLSNVVTIAAGLKHSLALKADGTVVVWGSNSDGQGVIPNGLTGVTTIAAGANHNLALLAADTSAPDTSITAQPADPSNSSSAGFTFTGVDNMTPANGLTFQCQVDGGAFTACTSPQSYSGLSGGSHTFAVRATDGAGNVDSSAATYSWTIIPPAPLLGITGDAVAISRGDTTPAALDHTDFLSATVSSGSVVRTFVIDNNGNADLTGLAVSVTGGNSSDFAVSLAPATTVAPGNNTTFQIRFTPSALGSRTTTVNIASNDSTQNPYTFAIAGTGIALPQPTLAVPGTPVWVINGRFSLPVQFTANSKAIAAVGFSVDYDERCLIFDATDSDDNGVPDAIAGLPSAFAANISHDPADITGELDIALYDDLEPIATLETGTLLTVAFTVAPVCSKSDGSPQAVTVNFSTNPTPSFGDPAAADVTGDATGATIILSFNATPTALALSNDNIDENVAAGTTIGTLSTTDPDAGDSHTYSLVDGAGSADNSGFTITGNALKTTASFNHEPKPEHTIRVRTTDAEGLYFEQTFLIKANDVYEAPQGINTTDGPSSDGNNTTVDINENAASSTTVAFLNPSNPDRNNRYTYALATGNGDTDNNSFFIDADALKSAVVFDYENKNSYTVRVQITDRNGATAEQSLTILINNVEEALNAVDDLIDPRTTIFIGGQAAPIDVLANDVANGATLTVASVTQPAAGSGSVTNNSSNVSYTAPQANGSTTFTYQATNGLTTSNNATVSLSYVANQTRGDCNSNGNVAAADFIAIVLEIFDANDTPYNSGPAWWLIHTGDYAGSPLGCDANGSRNGANNSSDSITAADITCSVLIFFGHACGTGLQAASADQAASLSVATSANGGQTTIPVMLKSGGHAVAGVAFALELGNSAFDATDANGDGLPDAVTLNVPAGVTKSVVWNAQARRLEVALYGVSLPLPTLSDGVLATVTVDGAATPTLTLVSLSDTNGNDLLTSTRRGLFLPLATR